MFQRAVEGLIEEEEWRKAAQTAKGYDEWLTERTEMEELAERVEEIEELYEEQRGGESRPRTARATMTLELLTSSH